MAHVAKSTAGGDGAAVGSSAGEVKPISDEHEGLEITGQVAAPPQSTFTNYNQRSEEFRKTFKELAESERLVLDYACALQKDILLQGRLYLTENCLCFYSNVFWGTKITLHMKDITSITREKTARLIPNAIQICTNTERLFFSSFSAREKTFQNIFRLWQNILKEKPMQLRRLFQLFSEKSLYHADICDNIMAK